MTSIPKTENFGKVQMGLLYQRLGDEGSSNISLAAERLNPADQSGVHSVGQMPQSKVPFVAILADIIYCSERIRLLPSATRRACFMANDVRWKPGPQG